MTNFDGLIICVGPRQLIVQRMADNEKIVTRYMDDREFGDAAFGLLSQAIYDSIPPALAAGR